MTRTESIVSTKVVCDISISADGYAARPRQPLTMQGGTTFTFVTDGIESALDQARKAAGDRNVAIAGGAATINQYLATGLIDELRTHIAPVTVRGASLVTHISYRVVH